MSDRALETSQEKRVCDAFEGQGMMTTLGVRLTRVARGEVEIALPFAPHIAQQHGFVHAGGLTTGSHHRVQGEFPEPGDRRTIYRHWPRAPGRQAGFVVDGEVIAEDAAGYRKTVALMLATMMGVRLGESRTAV